MEKSSAHANAVYRCAALTADADVPDLEENKQDSIKTKKLLEQIALYFEWNAGTWSAKSGEKLLQDTCLWRCIAHLYCWGRNAKFRSRLVCIFHASNYMFEKSSFKGSVSLEVFRFANKAVFFGRCPQTNVNACRTGTFTFSSPSTCRRTRPLRGLE
jgi:hypothetical protein